MQPREMIGRCDLPGSMGVTNAVRVNRLEPVHLMQGISGSLCRKWSRAGVMNPVGAQRLGLARLRKFHEWRIETERGCNPDIGR